MPTTSQRTDSHYKAYEFDYDKIVDKDRRPENFARLPHFALSLLKQERAEISRGTNSQATDKHG